MYENMQIMHFITKIMIYLNNKNVNPIFEKLNCNIQV